MAEVLVETPATNVDGAPRLLRALWEYLHPDSPVPLYRVYHYRPTGSTREFSAAVHLVISPGSSEHGQVIRSGVTTQLTRAIREAALDALVFLRTFDPVMSACTLFEHVPRLDLTTGNTFVSTRGLEDPPLSHLADFTTTVYQYLLETLSELSILRHELATMQLQRTLRLSRTFLGEEFPPSLIHYPSAATPHSTLNDLRRMLAANPTTVVPPPSDPVAPSVPPSLVPTTTPRLRRQTTTASRYLSRFAPIGASRPPPSRRRSGASGSSPSLPETPSSPPPTLYPIKEEIGRAHV